MNHCQRYLSVYDFLGNQQLLEHVLITVYFMNDFRQNKQADLIESYTSTKLKSKIYKVYIFIELVQIWIKIRIQGFIIGEAYIIWSFKCRKVNFDVVNVSNIIHFTLNDESVN